MGQCIPAVPPGTRHGGPEQPEEHHPRPQATSSIFSVAGHVEVPEIAPVRYLNAMMDSAGNPDAQPDNIIDMRRIFQREFGGSMIFFHHITNTAGTCRGQPSAYRIGRAVLHRRGGGHRLSPRGTTPRRTRRTRTERIYPIESRLTMGLGYYDYRRLPVRPGSVIFTKSGWHARDTQHRKRRSQVCRLPLSQHLTNRAFGFRTTVYYGAHQWKSCTRMLVFASSRGRRRLRRWEFIGQVDGRGRNGRSGGRPGVLTTPISCSTSFLSGPWSSMGHRARMPMWWTRHSRTTRPTFRSRTCATSCSPTRFGARHRNGWRLERAIPSAFLRRGAGFGIGSGRRISAW